MEIYLIRHTTPKIDKGVCYGFSDIELAESYRDELNVVSEKITQYLHKNCLKNEKQEELTIYTSPLQRCAVLAKDVKISLENYFHPKIEHHKHLKEMNFGDWELKKWEDINKKELKEWTDNFVTAFTPNGESFEQLHKRVTDFWTKNIVSEKGKIALVVCHGGVIRSILCHVLEIPLQNAFSLSIDYGSISKLKVFETHVQVEFLNH